MKTETETAVVEQKTDLDLILEVARRNGLRATTLSICRQLGDHHMQTIVDLEETYVEEADGRLH